MATPAPTSAPSPRVIALAGRQNAGKTSVMMHLTGTTQRPVNFPGSSVERSEGTVQRGGATLRIVDLPGLASLRPVSQDEELACAYLRGDAREAPDLICAVFDATKLSVELRLYEELRGLGRPVVIALNKIDMARATGAPVDVPALAERLGVPVIATDALHGQGFEALLDILAGAPPAVPGPLPASPDALAREVAPTPPPRRSRTDALDAVLLHRVFGLPLLGFLMWAVFQVIYVGADPFMGLIEDGQAALSGLVEGALGPGALRSFLVDGLINGVGSVLIFLPQIVLLIAMVALLEGSGYMARAAFLLDQVLRRVGLSGRSFVPLVSSFACAVPGILATRIIDNERDRLATIAVAPLMSCSARLPVYVVLIGAFFPARWAGLVLVGLYAVGIVVAAAVAWWLRRGRLQGGTSVMMMELPSYQRPSLRVVWAQVKAAGRDFIVLAGTLIFATAVVIWALSYYPRPQAIHDAHEAQRAAVTAAGADAEAAIAAIDADEDAAYLEQSWLARMGKAIQPVFAPAGFDWRVTVGVLASFPARELIIPTLGILYRAGDVDPGAYDTDELAAADRDDGLRAKLRGANDAEGRPTFDALTALALMVFFALCSQCAATLGAIRRETRSWRWPAFVFTYMTVLAWAAAVAVQQIGRILGLGAL